MRELKFRNKFNGEIRPAELREDGIYLYDKTIKQWFRYGLQVLADCWEYYKEPKTFYNILSNGGVTEKENTTDDLREEFIKDAKEIGNYFLSREEAEKAVEKLKAWKRLKDAGFVFCGKGDCLDTIKFGYGECGYNRQDFALLFGEEEE